MKLGERAQMRQHEKEEKEQAEARARAALSPNQLRGQIDLHEDSDDEDAGADADGKAAGKTSATEWGKKARRRQRKFVADMLDAHEQQLRESKEEEEDKDIEEFLLKE